MASNCNEVTPYWSTRKGEDRYHVCSNCDKGNNIETDYKKSGLYPPAGYSLCDTCHKMRLGLISR